MKVTVVGYWGAYPEANQATSGYLIQTEEVNLLLDCGSGVLSTLQAYLNLTELDAVILSHYHADHLADIYSLHYGIMILRQLSKRQKPLDIYGHAEDQKFATLAYKQHCLAHSIAPGQVLELGDLRINFEENVHPVYSLSMRIQHDDQTLVYTGDTGWSDKIISLAKDADLFLCEASLYNDQQDMITGHLTGGQAGEIAKQAGVGRLVLTHLPHYGNHLQLVEEAKEHYAGPIDLASEGLSWEL